MKSIDEAQQLQPPASSNTPSGNEIDLRELLDVVLESRILILSVAAAVVLVGVLYLWLATPIYGTNALLQVEKTQSTIPGLDELSSALGNTSTQSQAEIQIILSRSVLDHVVEDLGLDLQATPRRFPLIGSAIARGFPPGQVVDAWPGFRHYAWGGERVVIGRLSVSSALEETELTLEAGKNGAYTLYDDDGNTLVNGEVGKAASGKLPAGDVDMFVRELTAQPGTHFTVVKRSFDNVVARMQEKIKVVERGKQTGILEVSLEGRQPVVITAIVNHVVNRYVRQNVERRSEEASRMLAFLNEQLPQIKSQLTTAESTLSEYNAKQGKVVDISVEGQDLLNRLTDVDKQVAELEMQRSELKQNFTEQHPALIVLQQKLNQLKQISSGLDGQLKKLPSTELQSIRLMRDVTVTNGLYVELLNKSEELKVAKAGTVGNARILDTAILPRNPVSPKKLMIFCVSILLGLVSGVLVAFARKALQRTLDNPDQIEAKLGLPVYATIPHSIGQHALGRGSSREADSHAVRLVCRTEPMDPAVESLRSLRTSLQFAMIEAKNNIVTIHGPTPGIGKSFVSTNLAFLLADVDKRVLLVDADMRNGHIHAIIKSAREPGLSNVIAGQCQLKDAVHVLEDGKIGLLASGTLPPNPSELLVHSNFTTMLALASKEYDYVILDTPPTLNLADGIAIGKQSGTNFLVVRGGKSTLQDVQISSRRLQQSGIRVDGVIFNDLSPTTSRYRYGGYYAYRYAGK